MLPSRLQSITYCPDTGDCAQPLNVRLGRRRLRMAKVPGFTLPDTLPGTWFMDLDGDGRLDMVSSQPADVSDGMAEYRQSFVNAPETWSLPSEVWQVPGDKSTGNTAFADLDGDGFWTGCHQYRAPAEFCRPRPRSPSG